jgi:hypothetical protein
VDNAKLLADITTQGLTRLYLQVLTLAEVASGPSGRYRLQVQVKQARIRPGVAQRVPGALGS